MSLALDKDSLYAAGVKLATAFCARNAIRSPEFVRIPTTDRRFSLGTCAYYRRSVIYVMVEKCASGGVSGRRWSWPGYAIDRTPYGACQHELGHHFDAIKSQEEGRLFSKEIHSASHEDPLTGYLGTNNRPDTYFEEWFAEIFRLFVTNPDLCILLRPLFCAELAKRKIYPVVAGSWRDILTTNQAPERTIQQALKKIRGRVGCLPETQPEEMPWAGKM